MESSLQEYEMRNISRNMESTNLQAQHPKHLIAQSHIGSTAPMKSYFPFGSANSEVDMKSQGVYGKDNRLNLGLQQNYPCSIWSQSVPPLHHGTPQDFYQGASNYQSSAHQAQSSLTNLFTSLPRK
jgi:hypothetical protein